MFEEKQKPVYIPVKYEPQHVTAVKELMVGTCPAHLQKEFVRWLIEDVCRTYDQSYHRDTHDTAFMEGRRFCGNTVVKMSKLSASKIRTKDQKASEYG